jgi:hypothetical protein
LAALGRPAYIARGAALRLVVTSTLIVRLNISFPDRRIESSWRLAHLHPVARRVGNTRTQPVGGEEIREHVLSATHRGEAMGGQSKFDPSPCRCGHADRHPHGARRAACRGHADVRPTWRAARGDQNLLGLAAGAVLASLLPAPRASGIDPIKVLRADSWNPARLLRPQDGEHEQLDTGGLPVAQDLPHVAGTAADIYSQTHHRASARTSHQRLRPLDVRNTVEGDDEIGLHGLSLDGHRRQSHIGLRSRDGFQNHANGLLGIAGAE